MIRLFASFPKDKNAGFENLRAWGAFLVSAEQTDGVIYDVKIFSERGRRCTVIKSLARQKSATEKKWKISRDS